MKGEAILVFDAHFDALTKMYWDENRRLLLTGSKDKTIKVTVDFTITVTDMEVS